MESNTHLLTIWIQEVLKIGLLCSVIGRWEETRTNMNIIHATAVNCHGVKMMNPNAKPIGISGNENVFIVVTYMDEIFFGVHPQTLQ